jgi:putative transposase
MRTVPANRALPDLTFFISTAVNDRLPVFSDDRAAQIALDCLQFFRRQGEIFLYGYVIMPDHLHLVFRPVPPLTLPKFVRRFKTFVAHEIGKGSIWQKGCWSEVIVNTDMLWNRVRYLNDNPVRAGLVAVSTDYCWSSAKEYLLDVPPGLIDSIG